MYIAPLKILATYIKSILFPSYIGCTYKVQPKCCSHVFNTYHNITSNNIYTSSKLSFYKEIASCWLWMRQDYLRTAELMKTTGAKVITIVITKVITKVTEFIWDEAAWLVEVTETEKAKRFKNIFFLGSKSSIC